jgi:hypothetical protein
MNNLQRHLRGEKGIVALLTRRGLLLKQQVCETCRHERATGWHCCLPPLFIVELCLKCHRAEHRKLA